MIDQMPLSIDKDSALTLLFDAAEDYRATQLAMGKARERFIDAIITAKRAQATHNEIAEQCVIEVGNSQHLSRQRISQFIDERRASIIYLPMGRKDRGVPNERVPNEVFRAKYKQLATRERLTLAEVAVRLGWETKDKEGFTKPDSARVSRTLGLVAESGQFRDSVSYNVAVLLCRALHVAPYEIDI